MKKGKGALPGPNCVLRADGLAGIVPHSGGALVNTEQLLQILACPRCKGDLTALGDTAQPEGLACAACNEVYPVRDDIPVMLLEEAIARADWDNGLRDRKQGRAN